MIGDNLNPTAAPGRSSSLYETPLENPFISPIELKKEAARHRAMCSMSIAGFTNKEIAAAFCCTAASVGIVLNQPRSQEFMRAETQLMGEDFRERIVAEGQAAFARIVERATDDLVPVAIKQKDDHALVDRWLGKAVQPITTGVKAPTEMSLEEIKAELQIGRSN